MHDPEVLYKMGEKVKGKEREVVDDCCQGDGLPVCDHPIEVLDAKKERRAYDKASKGKNFGVPQVMMVRFGIELGPNEQEVYNAEQSGKHEVFAGQFNKRHNPGQSAKQDKQEYMQYSDCVKLQCQWFHHVSIKQLFIDSLVPDE
jgi:hypothetical protein